MRAKAKAAKPKSEDLRALYSAYRDKLSVREAAYAVARKTGKAIGQVCEDLGLTTAYIDDGRKLK